MQPGWRALLEARLGAGHAAQATYRYTWNFQPRRIGRAMSFGTSKIHARHGYRWTHPVHEVLALGPGRAEHAVTGRRGDAAGPPRGREQVPGQYLPLLELSVQEDPEDDRNMHYLGREYMFHGDWDKCIATLLRHLGMPSARWADERSASMRFIARAYAAKGEREPARAWYLRAIAEAPHLREPYLDFGALPQRGGRSRGRRVAVRPGAGHRRAAPHLYHRGQRLGQPARGPALPGAVLHRTPKKRR